MAILYDRAAALDALVLGTSNKSEIALGYTTLWGDMAADCWPLGDLYKTQVLDLARAIGLPAGVVERAPSAELWDGQTDESELGFTYGQADLVLYAYLEGRRRPEEIAGPGIDGDTGRARVGSRAAERVQAPVAVDPEVDHANRGSRFPASARVARAGLIGQNLGGGRGSDGHHDLGHDRAVDHRVVLPGPDAGAALRRHPGRARRKAHDRRVQGTIDEVRVKANPILFKAQEVASDIQEMTATARREAERVGASIENVSGRVDDFAALIEVVQEQVERPLSALCGGVDDRPQDDLEVLLA